MNSEPSQSDAASSSSDPTSVTEALIEAPLAASHETASNADRASSGPLNLQKLRSMRAELDRAQSGSRPDKSSKRDDRPNRKPKVDNQSGDKSSTTSGEEAATTNEMKIVAKKSDADAKDRVDPNRVVAPRVSVPTARTPLTADQMSELESALIDADLDALMIGDKTVQVGRTLESGERYQGKVMKVHGDSVFISLGGPDEGIVPLLQFLDMPQAGQTLDFIVRGFNNDEGLYELAMPGESVSVEDWSDLESGAVVDAKVESSNTGGLECLVGSIRGFIPLSQVSEYRIEDVTPYVGKTLTCVVTEANPRRGNLILSHRAILEREKAAKREERLASIAVGDTAEGTVRKITDFGAFVDIGGLDGLIHISQLSWDRVKHPSEVVKEGDSVKVRIEKIDPETGKIGLSYRSQEDHPWNNIETRFPVGNIVQGTVSRIASFGVFIKLDIGIEGLVHVSEMAHRRVSSPASLVDEGQQVDVKILSVDRESQRIGLSLKQAQAAPSGSENTTGAQATETEDDKPRPLAVAKHRGPLKGGTGSGSSGDLFGLKW